MSCILLHIVFARYLDCTEGDSLDCTEGDSSVITPDDRDSEVQPIKCDSSTCDSADFTFDEQGPSFFRGRLMVPSVLLKVGSAREGTRE